MSDTVKPILTVDPHLLQLLVCPVTKQSLAILPDRLLQKLNASISEGDVKSNDGETVSNPVQQALITQNGTQIYRVEQGVPMLLDDQGIRTSQLSNWM